MSRKRYVRHPAEVTYDRLVDHSEKYTDLMDGAEKDALAVVCQVLYEIANGERVAS